MPFPPSSVTHAAVSSIVSARSYSDRWFAVVRPGQTTVAPASPSAAAMPRPAPRGAPATTSTFLGSASGSGDHAIGAPLASVEDIGRGTPRGALPERVTRIELAFSAWEADVLPLNYTRGTGQHTWHRRVGPEPT